MPPWGTWISCPTAPASDERFEVAFADDEGEQRLRSNLKSLLDD